MSKRRKYTDRRLAYDDGLLSFISDKLTAGQPVTLTDIPADRARSLRSQFYYWRQLQQINDITFLARACTELTINRDNPGLATLTFKPSAVDHELRRAAMQAGFDPHDPRYA